MAQRVRQRLRAAVRHAGLLSLGVAFALASSAAYGSPSLPEDAAPRSGDNLVPEGTQEPSIGTSLETSTSDDGVVVEMREEQLEHPEDGGNGARESDDDLAAQSGQDELDGAENQDGEDEGEAATTTLGLRNAPEPLQANAGCSYADPGTGAYAQTLCWLNFDGFSHTSGTTNYPVSIPLPGGYTFTANLRATGGGAGSAEFPTWTGSFLGNRNFYTGVQGTPALYQTADKTTTTLRLENIRVTNASGQHVAGYGLVVADAESTDSRESITWTTDVGSFQLLPNSPTSNYGNACNRFTNSRGTAVCTGPGGTPKTGTVMLSATAPANEDFYVQQVLVGGGKQGVAFGVMFATVRAEVEIVDRIDVDLPVYHGTSDEVLNEGAGHLQGSHYPVGGAGTRTVITAHRGLPDAKMFDDLGKLVIGDRFTIETFGEVLTYEVVESQVIEPHETDTIRLQEGRDLATLITCTPLGLNTHRIIVTGERVLPTPQEDLDGAGGPSDLPRFPWWALILVAGLAAISWYLVRQGRKDAAPSANEKPRRDSTPDQRES